MFTGIITDIGIVRSAEQRADLRLTIACRYDLATVDVGASIACSGACLTVVDKGPNDPEPWFAVDVSAESVSRTAPGRWTEGSRLNLERALKVGDELGGHIVTGHVDGVATVVSVEHVGGSWAIALDAPRALARAIAPKGSITLDGVSLTVNAVEDRGDTTRFTVNIIPHTADHTTLGSLSVGGGVNLEIDVLARYMQRMTEARMG